MRNRPPLRGWKTDEALASLLERLADSPADERAWTELYERLWTFVLATNYRLLGGERDSAEDVSQEIFIRLARYCPFKRLREPAKFKGYLRVMCRNACRTLLAVWSRDASSTLLLAEIDSHSVDVELEGKVAADELLRQMLEELDDARDREVLRCLAEGDSLREIAQRTGMSYSNAGVRVFRLRRKLRRFSAQRGNGPKKTEAV
jgi:RNA polymerase sigma factor (sigma-70 family)